MGNYIAYILQVAFFTALLYPAYRLLLGHTTFHKFNRTVILCIIAVAYVLPLGIPSFIHNTSDFVNEAMVSPASAETYAVGNTDVSLYPGINWGLILSVVYAAGLIIAVVINCLVIYRIVNIIRKGYKSSFEKYILVVTSQAPGPFSWGRYIVVRPEDCDNDLEMILEHEKSHLTHYHWIDLIFTQLSNIAQWFNPVAYMLTRELKNIHEYQADEYVSKLRSSSYQMMLLRKTAGKLCPVFTNGFNHTQIKSRISMMLRKRSNPTCKFAVVLLPVVAYFSLASMAHPTISSIINNIKISDSPSDINKEPEVKVVTIASDKPMTDGSRMTGDRKESLINDTEESESITIKQIDTIHEKQKKSIVDSYKVTGVKSVKKDTVVRYKYDNSKATLPDKNKKEPAYFVDGELFSGNLNDIDVSTIESINVYKNDDRYPNGLISIKLKKVKSLSPESGGKQQKNGEDLQTSYEHNQG